MQNIKIVIVDDEAHARNVLSTLLTEFIEDVEIVGFAESVSEAIKVIDKTKPELIFLDIQMPGGNGLTLLDQYEKPKFEVIFTTAYDNYAIEAIKKAALDYIMKPIEVDELTEAIERFRTKRKFINGEPEESFIILDFEEAGKQNVKIAVPNLKGFDFIKVKNIIYCNSDSNYCEFHMDDGKKLVSSQTLKFFDDKLDGYGFLRVHDSFMVNLSKIKKYNRGRGGSLELIDGTIVPVSRSRKDDLIEAFNG